MAIASLDDDTLKQAVELEQKHRSNAAAAARELGITRSAFQNRLKQAAKRGYMGTLPVLPGFAIKKTSSQLGPDGELQREWVQQSPEAGDEFSLPEGHVIKGVSALLNEGGRVVQQWVKTRTDSAVPDIIAACKSCFESLERPAKLIKPPRHTDADLLSVYPIADQHNGLRSWGAETGENYDLEIGAARLRECSARLVSQSPASGQAIILNLGDWQHTDDQKNMTPRSGNILDVDGRNFKVLTTGIQLMMDVIELALQKHESVTVRNLPGNHDPHAAIALTVALAAFYKSNPRVTIDDDPSDLFFHRFGATLIGANHGHKMRADAMAMCMAVRRREDWGATKFHYFYFGHIHHETAKEVGDVRVESFQTLSAKDAHASSSGYCSGQSLTSITIHRENGEIGRHRVNV